MMRSIIVDRSRSIDEGGMVGRRRGVGDRGGDRVGCRVGHKGCYRLDHRVFHRLVDRLGHQVIHSLVIHHLLTRHDLPADVVTVGKESTQRCNTGNSQCRVERRLIEDLEQRLTEDEAGRRECPCLFLGDLREVRRVMGRVMNRGMGRVLRGIGIIMIRREGCM